MSFMTYFQNRHQNLGVPCISMISNMVYATQSRPYCQTSKYSTMCCRILLRSCTYIGEVQSRLCGTGDAPISLSDDML